MPDPVSRAIEPTFFRWDASMPPPAAQAVSDMAQYGIVVAVILVGLAALWIARGAPRERVTETVLRLAPGIVAVAVAFAVAHVAGRLVIEVRPFVLLGQPALFAHAADASFPSDHVTAGMAMLGARIGRGARWLTALVVALVGLARVIAGVHWMIDIVGGAAIGLVLAWLASLAWSALSPRIPALRTA